MKKETLKQLIEVEYERCGTISQFKSEVFRLLDLYESDENVINGIGVNPITRINGTFLDKVPYHTICSCNPINGGNGICGCTIANILVDKPNNLKTNI
jgi:hypothetical protein